VKSAPGNQQLRNNQREFKLWTTAELSDRKVQCPRDWCEQVQDFGRMFCSVAGRPQTIDATRSRIDQHRFNVGRKTRELLAETN
jgi:hypothetical protein